MWSPAFFGEGQGAYDELEQLAFGVMYHGMTYADEAYSPETENRMTVNLWRPVMEKGVIHFPRPEDCPMHKTIREMKMKVFSEAKNNFSCAEEG